MARLYSKKKGKSGSTKPSTPNDAEWVNKDAKAVTDLIVDMGKKGQTASQIGIVLRDSYAVPDVKVLLGKRVSQILKENKVLTEVPDDLLALIKKDLAITKHREENKKDMTAKRGQQLTLGKISRLVNYYKSTGVLEADWKYNREKATQWVV